MSSSDNSSNSDDVGDVVETLGSSFFTWFLRDVLPVLFCVIMSIILVSGIFLHSIILAGLSKNKLRTKAPYRIIQHVEVLDMVSMVLVVLPALISSATDRWVFGKAGCYILGMAVMVHLIMTFVYAVWSAAERCLKMYHKSVHEAIFVKKGGKKWIIIMVCTWVLVAGLTVLSIPEVNLSGLQYRTHGYQCDLEFEARASTITYFTCVYIFAVVTLVVFYSMLVHKRRMQLKTVTKLDSKGPKQSTTEKEKGATTSSSHGEGTSSRPISSNEPGPNRIRSANIATPRNVTFCEDVETVDKTPKLSTGFKFSAKKKWGVALSKLTHVQVFQSHGDYHVGLTSCITWSVAIFLWLPYVIVGFVIATEDPDDPAWEGWYPLAVMFAYLNYMIKPIIYLAHNKPIRKDVRAMFPKTAKKLDETQRKLHEGSNAIDALLFKQPDRRVSLGFWKRPEIGNLVSAKLAIGKWKKRAGKNKESKELVDVTEEDIKEEQIIDLDKKS